MPLPDNYTGKIAQAWRGRISGCMLGKAVELFSMRAGADALQRYLLNTRSLPLRDYIPHDPEHASDLLFTPCCQGNMQRSEADDDINYSVLALMLLEAHGADLSTEDVARAWLKWLPLASTFTAERAAYTTLLARGEEWFPEGRDLGFEITECANNPYNDWIGAQIRADVYGWVVPGDAARAATLATLDARLSHSGDGIYGAVVIAVMGAMLAGGDDLDRAVDEAFRHIPSDSRCADAMQRALALTDAADGGDQLRRHYGDMSVVHTVNNLALVIWALSRHRDDFDAAIGEVVTAGLDTDCNGATVGALWVLQGGAVPDHWVLPWQAGVGVSLAGMATLALDELVERTVNVARSLAAS